MSFVSFVRRLLGREPPDPFALPHIWYEGGDGASPIGAIIVVGALSDLEGVAATFGWMHRHIGPKDEAWRLLTHSTGGDDRRKIDTFKIELPDGTQRTIFFDVTESFGRPFRPGDS